MPNMEEVPYDVALREVVNWKNARTASSEIAQFVLQPEFYFVFDVQNLPESLQGEGHAHGYLALDQTDDLTTAQLSLLLIDAETDANASKAKDKPALYRCPYVKTEEIKTPGAQWKMMLDSWNNTYAQWLEEVNQTECKATQAFIIPKSDFQRRGNTTKFFAFWGLKDPNRKVWERPDLLFYDTTNGDFNQLVPADFTTPVPPLPKGGGFSLLSE